jgi:integrase
MNALGPALRTYVAMRRGLGYKVRQQEKSLSDFVRFMEVHGAAVITRKLALEWATQPPDRHATWRLRLIDVRGFARHLLSVEPRTEVPPTGLLPGRSRPTPYLYTKKEITELLEAALDLRPPDGLRRWTYYCLLGLLAVSGLRIGEAVSLRREDVDLEQGVLTIHGTKFGKSRLVPVHSTTQRVLMQYAKRRDGQLCPPRSPYFFVAARGGQLRPRRVREVFHRLSWQTGLREPEDHTGPRLHDFRHHFAVQTLLGWYRSGRNVEPLLPVLSTYLGHTCMRDTYWYLSTCPELMGQAVRMLESRWGRLS